MRNRNILISGAGIAGPTVAYWLSRYGFNPTVVERAPVLRQGGYKVDIRGAAIEVVKRMGILDRVRQKSTAMRGATFVNRHGKRVATMDAELFGGRSPGDVEILRGDLARILYETTRHETEYIFNDSILAMKHGATCIEVTFANGPPRRFDLVIGADGLHSNVRTLTLGDESEMIRHLGHYFAICTIPNPNLDRSELLYAVPGKTINIYNARQSKSANALFLWAAPPFDYDRHDIASQKQILAKTFQGVGWEANRFIGAMWESPDFYFDSLSQVRLDRWSSGRVALLGDASYCASLASGQGSSLSLVGAYVLAGELAAARGDFRTAFARYEDEMQSFVDQNQKLASTNLKGMVLRSKAQIWFQLRMLRMLPYLPGKERIIGRVTEAIHQAATSIRIKEYALDR